MFNIYDCWGTLLATRKQRRSAVSLANKMIGLGYKLHYVTDDEKNEVVWVGFKHPDDLRCVIEKFGAPV